MLFMRVIFRDGFRIYICCYWALGYGLSRSYSATGNAVLSTALLKLCRNLCLYNDTHREKLRFTKFSTKMAAWLLLDFFICLRNHLSSIHSIVTYQKVCFKIVVLRNNSKNQWLLLSASFTAKFLLTFVLTLKNVLS